MSVLVWDKPQKAMTIEEWKAISADSAPPGVYTPNMSYDDRQKWKAKLVGKTTDTPRVEIRKSLGGVQMLIVVRLGDGDNVKISLNGSGWFSWTEIDELNQAIQESKQVLEQLGEFEEGEGE